MKIRNGFVSNSSSSSFVIATEDDKPISVTVTLDHLIKHKITNEEQLRKYYVEELCVIDEVGNFEDSYYEEEYKKYIQYLNEGKIIQVGDVSSEDGDGLSEMIYNSGFSDIKMPKSIKILQEP